MKQLKIFLLIFCVFSFITWMYRRWIWKARRWIFVCKDAQFRILLSTRMRWWRPRQVPLYPWRIRRRHASRFISPKRSLMRDIFSICNTFPRQVKRRHRLIPPTSTRSVSASPTEPISWETNEGGKLDFTDNSTKREASIGAYRANAACAELSRYIITNSMIAVGLMAISFGGSGGAYRTIGSMEAPPASGTEPLPFVLGSPNAIPMVFAVRMYALRILKDKLADIIDAMDAGGSGDHYTRSMWSSGRCCWNVPRWDSPEIMVWLALYGCSRVPGII